MGDREFFKVKDGSAFAAIKGKKVYITKTIPNTTSGVIVCINGTSDTFKFLREELEPWVEASSREMTLEQAQKLAQLHRDIEQMRGAIQRSSPFSRMNMAYGDALNLLVEAKEKFVNEIYD